LLKPTDGFGEIGKPIFEDIKQNDQHQPNNQGIRLTLFIQNPGIPTILSG